MQQDTFNHVKTHFSEACHRVIEDQDVLLVTREDADNVVIMPQSLFDSWQETMYLLKSPANAAILEKSPTEQQSGETLSMYVKQNEFDKNNKVRIYNLMVLKGHCLSYSENLMSNYMTKYNYSNVQGKNFYNAISDVTDLLLFFFINDEISACLEERGPILELLNEVVSENRTKENIDDVKISLLDIQKLFHSRTDFVIGSSLLDFTVSTFSVFEYYVSKIYDKLKIENTKDSKKTKLLKKYIKDYNNCEEQNKEAVLEKIMKNCSSYVSSSQKIEFVLSKVNSSDYSRDLSTDKETINFYRNERNTIHNLGINKQKSSSSQIVKGIQISLDANKPSYTENHNSSIFLCEELVKIYSAIINNLNLFSDDCCVEVEEWN